MRCCRLHSVAEGDSALESCELPTVTVIIVQAYFSIAPYAVLQKGHKGVWNIVVLHRDITHRDPDSSRARLKLGYMGTLVQLTFICSP